MSVALLLACSLILLAVSGFVTGAWLLLHPARTRQDRLVEYTGGIATPVAGPVRRVSRLSVLAERIAALAREDDQEEVDSLRRRLLQAGIRSPTAAAWLSTIRVVLALSLPMLAFALLPAMPLTHLAVCVMFFAFFGYYLPARVVEHIARKRGEAIMRGFPDALDLLVASVEAGLGLEAALARVANEMEQVAPELSLELQVVGHEVQAGIPRSDALRRLSVRAGLEAVTSLVNVLVQSEKLGTSVARALRVHANMVRQRRMLAAEETAAKISPKMTIGMIIFLLPCLFVAILGPAAVNLIRNLIPVLMSR